MSRLLGLALLGLILAFAVLGAGCRKAHAKGRGWYCYIAEMTGNGKAGEMDLCERTQKRCQADAARDKAKMLALGADSFTVVNECQFQPKAFTFSFIVPGETGVGAFPFQASCEQDRDIVSRMPDAIIGPNACKLTN